MQVHYSLIFVLFVLHSVTFHSINNINNTVLRGNLHSVLILGSGGGTLLLLPPGPENPSYAAGFRFFSAEQLSYFIAGVTDESPAVTAPVLWNYDVCGRYQSAVTMTTWFKGNMLLLPCVHADDCTVTARDWVKTGRAVPGLCSRRDRQTHTQTDTSKSPRFTTQRWTIFFSQSEWFSFLVRSPLRCPHWQLYLETILFLRPKFSSR